MATSPSVAPQTSSMEEPQQPDQPVRMQPDGEANHAVIEAPPADSEQQTPPSTMDAPEEKEAEEKGMDHLTVISECTETSEFSKVQDMECRNNYI